MKSSSEVVIIFLLAVIIVGGLFVYFSLQLPGQESEQKPDFVLSSYDETRGLNKADFPLIKPTKQWVERYGDGDESILAFNVYAIQSTMQTYSKKIGQIVKRLQALEDPNSGS